LGGIVEPQKQLPNGEKANGQVLLGSDDNPNEIERRRIALYLRSKGASFYQIGQRLGLSPQGAKRVFDRALLPFKEELSESATEQRLVAHEANLWQIAQLFLKAYPEPKKLPDGKVAPPEFDYEAIAALTKIREFDARLMGYYSPQKYRVDVRHLGMQVTRVAEVLLPFIRDESVTEAHAAIDELVRSMSERRVIEGEAVGQ